MEIITFLDASAKQITFKVVSRTVYRTYTMIYAICIDCLPEDECEDIRGRVVRILLPYGYENYIVMNIKIPRFKGIDNIFVISGTVKAHKGYLTFIPAYDFSTFLTILSGEKDCCSIYRDLYLKTKDQILSMLDKFKNDLVNNLDTVEKITNEFRELYKRMNMFLERTLGLVSRGSEALILGELGITKMMETVSPPPPVPPSPPIPSPPPPKPSLIERIKSLFRKLFRGG